MRLLLDTHIWLWSLLQPQRLSDKVSRALRDSESELWLSSISLWEVMILVEKGRLRLNKPVEHWMDDALSRTPLREAPVSHITVRHLSTIKTPHQDPADRFIAATAAALDLELVTADSKLLEGSGYRVLPNRSAPF